MSTVSGWSLLTNVRSPFASEHRVPIEPSLGITPRTPPDGPRSRAAGNTSRIVSLTKSIERDYRSTMSSWRAGRFARIGAVITARSDSQVIANGAQILKYTANKLYLQPGEWTSVRVIGGTDARNSSSEWALTPGQYEIHLTPPTAHPPGSSRQQRSR